MEKFEIIMITIIIIFNIIGLILTLLQEKGTVKAILTDTPFDWHFESGGKITLVATILGAYMLYQYSIFVSILYVTIFVGIYLFIKLKKK